ncbi:uncharacterized protein BO80DRAFT_436713 [Aspergillus ibericus CBS 121593]|uniref:Uncharacterized protein n=1 Tax=Aspergillus ibericus CBS 121593 TaxID=1448316 RepID=A0A395GTP3_9EURO|nr:hypothetical protein BO80DRAFT_436713 [Aspergillus ibericus CBS 121593]RAK98806.1 hypothetical protein BO80DRAFT_436713 [Aspergillus ibericus CBS 121593]
MSAAIHTEIVDAEEFFPTNLTPWIYKHADIADLDCMERWPIYCAEFEEFFHLLNTHFPENNLFDPSLAEPDPLEAYYPEAEDYCPVAIGPDLLEEAAGGVETVALPIKSWKYSTRESSEVMMRSQGLMLRTLIETIYLKLNGRQWASTSNQYVPVLSFAGWFQEQTWSEFLSENPSIMLGQLASNIKLRLQDQEMFVVGCYKRQVFLARGLFTKDQISRVHAKGFSANEVFHLDLTRGYDVSNKGDWFEAMKIFAGLLRYILSGNARHYHAELQ